MRDKDLHRVAQCCERHKASPQALPTKGNKEAWALVNYAMSTYPLLVACGIASTGKPEMDKAQKPLAVWIVRQMIEAGILTTDDLS